MKSLIQMHDTIGLSSPTHYSHSTTLDRQTNINRQSCTEQYIKKNKKKMREDSEGGTVMAGNCSLASSSHPFVSNNMTLTAGGFLVLQM